MKVVENYTSVLIVHGVTEFTMHMVNLGMTMERILK
jgi:hypothetical protein